MSLLGVYYVFINMPSQHQTIEITRADSTNVILSLERYPICPTPLSKYDNIYLDNSRKDQFCWYPNGDVSILFRSKTRFFFYKKPTIADAILNTSKHSGSYTRFFSNGSVERKVNNQCYWWGITSEIKPEKGVTYTICKSCGTKNCYEECNDGRYFTGDFDW
jgi:hypothetical protein